MKKDKDETKKTPRGSTSSRGLARDWHRLLARLREMLDWALDIATKLARHDDEEIGAIERTRGYLHAWLAGRAVELDMNDVITTLAILFAAIDLDPDSDSVSAMAALPSYPPLLRLPGAQREERGSVVIRRFVPQRTTCASLFPVLAAA